MNQPQSQTKDYLLYESSSEVEEVPAKKRKTTSATPSRQASDASQAAAADVVEEEEQGGEKRKKKGGKELEVVAELPTVNQATMDRYTVKKREKVPFSKLIWDTEKKMGQCRSLKEWLVQKYYKSLKLGLPELPVSDVLGWNKQGVNHPCPFFWLTRNSV